jgi:hypothetical protein
VCVVSRDGLLYSDNDNRDMASNESSNPNGDDKTIGTDSASAEGDKKESGDSPNEQWPSGSKNVDDHG